jgi:hypothetical protein
MNSFEGQPKQQKQVPLEKAKELFSRMNEVADQAVDGKIDPEKFNTLPEVDGVEIIPGNIIEDELSEEDKQSFQTGASAMDEWQKKQEEIEDRRREDADN